VPNSIVVSRGCPHRCDFCYKESFFQGGKSFYTQSVDAAVGQIESLPGKHLYFLDDNLFGSPRFASELFNGMQGMGRLWQAASTVQAIRNPGLLDKAVAAGLRSLFIGFETLNSGNLKAQHKYHNLSRPGDGSTPHTLYEEVIQKLHDAGVMVNASFVFGMDQDDEDVFERTVEWAISQGIETATFHILTPYPGTVLHQHLTAQGRIIAQDWDLYDTRHAVYQPVKMSPEILEAGYWRAYRDFYNWGSIFRSSSVHTDWPGRLRHLAYTTGWKKFEPLWDVVIRLQRVANFRPLLEALLEESKGSASRAGDRSYIKKVSSSLIQRVIRD
jgi:radical SAM superfamily enzyme YgiQ (UPF0313 family)